MNYAAYYVLPLLVSSYTTCLLAEIFRHSHFKCAELRHELCCLLRAAAAGEQILPAYLQKSSDKVPLMLRATS